MSRLATRLVTLLAVVAALAFVALAAAGGYAYWNRVETNAEAQARQELPKLASDQLPRIFGYDYQTVERSLGDVYPMLTDDFRERFSEQVTKTVIPEARKRQLVVQVNVVGAGMLDAHRTSHFGLGAGVHEPDLHGPIQAARVRGQPGPRGLSEGRRRLEDAGHQPDLAGVGGPRRCQCFEERPGPAIHVVSQHLAAQRAHPAATLFGGLRDGRLDGVLHPV